MIKFNEELHKYTNEKNQVYTSATQLLGKYHKKFEEVEHFWSLYKALQYLADIDSTKIKKYDLELDLSLGKNIFSQKQYKYYQQKALRDCKEDYYCFLQCFSLDEQLVLKEACEKIKKFWKQVNTDSLYKGNVLHNFKENKLLADGKYKYDGILFPVSQNINATDELSNLAVGVHPELRVWNHENLIAGTIDQPIIYPHRKFKIGDHKTNLEIKFENKYQNMYAPIEHIEDCNYWHYALQLSIYAWMLEQFGYELLPDGLEIYHYNLEAVGKDFRIIDEHTYPVPYLKKEIIDILAYEKLCKNI